METKKEIRNYCKNKLNALVRDHMRKEEILSEQGKVQLASYRIEEVTKLLQTGKILEEFDRVMFKSLVRKITVLSNKEIEIEFECGITVRETL